MEKIATPFLFLELAKYPPVNIHVSVDKIFRLIYCYLGIILYIYNLGRYRNTQPYWITKRLSIQFYDRTKKIIELERTFDN
jgi:hypothetical protein